MSILYALIARRQTVLVEHASASGNFTAIARVILDRIPATENLKKSYVYDRHLFHFIVERGITYLCMSVESFERRRAFAFLEDIKNRFVSSYKNTMDTAHEGAMNSEFKQVLKKQMEYFSFDPNSDKISAVRKQIDDTKSIMVENIEKILDRGERIELLVDKTENLQQSSVRFKTFSKKLKYAMCWKNVKLIIAIVLAVMVLIWLIASFICGFTFKKCRPHHSATPSPSPSPSPSSPFRVMDTDTTW